MPPELVAVQLVTVESTSDALEEDQRYMAPPYTVYAILAELLAVQWETVEPMSDTLEVE